MAEPRKVFRIEETAGVPQEQSPASEQMNMLHTQLMQELNSLRAILMASNMPRKTGEAGRLTSELNLIHDAIGGDEVAATQQLKKTRVTHELDAVVSGSEKATHKILSAAEEIDQVANSLSATLKGKFEQGLAQDIQELVIKIFEACNFQDLIGQRITKVMTTLRLVEDHIIGVLDELKNPPPAAMQGAQRLHGPQLEMDRGHATQSDVDAMFSDNT